MQSDQAFWLSVISRIYPPHIFKCEVVTCVTWYCSSVGLVVWVDNKALALYFCMYCPLLVGWIYL